MTTPYHAKYYAHDLTRQAPASDPDRLSMSLFDATVDLNPHQIDAALFALSSPLSKGVILADEVGLGKTIEAGIVLCQWWAENKRRLIVICPASLRSQWQAELESKFNLPACILDTKSYNKLKKEGIYQPFQQKKIIIVSYHFANRMKEEIRSVDWHLAVLDEAHKLRNAYRDSNKLGQGIRWALNETKKLLLTATPLQNSLLELYGLSTLIDENMFGTVGAFRDRYVNQGGSLDELRVRLSDICKRTLRNQVLEYVPYTKRIPITKPFLPTNDEQRLYESVSAFLQREDTYSIPSRQKHLTLLLVRKLLASSSYAIAGTMRAIKVRLEDIRDSKPVDEEFIENLIEYEEIEDDLLDEILDSEDEPIDTDEKIEPIDYKKLQAEIDEVDRFATWASSIGVDTKSKVLLQGLQVGFAKMQELGAAQKALIFTESRRTQDYLKKYLEQNGYAGKVVAFNGTNTGDDVSAIYDQWLIQNKDTGRIAGSRAIDVRAALVDHFKDSATIMLATEAAAEGVNLQFCSLVVNYDLPWNPQRIEQRIGRCHRYGQKYDVVVINFFNERNHADVRVHELLESKFHLFDELFGASDEVLGSIEDGIDFEKRILAIYQQCRTPEEIDAAFNDLQAELDDSIKKRMSDTRQLLLEHFDEDVHQRLRFQMESAKQQLDNFSKKFWKLSKFLMNKNARFNETELFFDLEQSPLPEVDLGRYFLISKNKPKDESITVNDHGHHLYRLSHPLGEWAVQSAKTIDTPITQLTFDISNHGARIAMVEELKGKSGYLTLDKLTIQSFDKEEYLLFSAFTKDGHPVDQETCEKFFLCEAVSTVSQIPNDVTARLQGDAKRHAQATVSRSLEHNNQFFNEARDKLDRWADDMVFAAEKALRDTKEQIKSLKRMARQATSLQEQKDIQDKITQCERKQRKQRQEIFDVEDDIMGKRDALVTQLEARLMQSTSLECLFTVAWVVV